MTSEIADRAAAQRIGRARLTSKGQLTIPKAVRERLDLRPGDELEFVEESDGQFRLRREAPGYRKALEAWSGYIKDLEGVAIDDWIDEVRGR